jgi:RHS repeat-associated protein
MRGCFAIARLIDIFPPVICEMRERRITGFSMVVHIVNYGSGGFRGVGYKRLRMRVKYFGAIASTPTCAPEYRPEFCGIQLRKHAAIFVQIQQYWSVGGASGTDPVLSAIKNYAYDYNGNVTSERNYDWVSYPSTPANYWVNAQTSAPPTLPSSPSRTTTNSYYVAPDLTIAGKGYWSTGASTTGGPFLLNAVTSKEIVENAQPVTYSEFVYDSPTTTGNVTTELQWDSVKSPTFPGAQASGPAAGKLTRGSNSIATLRTYTSGDLTQETDPKGINRLYVYSNASPYPTDLYLALGTPNQRHWSFVWDMTAGLRTSETDVDNNATTTASYDARGRITSVDQAGLQRAITCYDDSAFVTTAVSSLATLVTPADCSTSNGIRRIRSLDDVGWVWKTQDTDDNGGYVTTQSFQQTPAGGGYTYQLSSNPYRTTGDTTMAWTRSELDPLGRVVEVAHFSGAGLPSPWGTPGTSAGTTTSSYNGNVTTVVDEALSRRSLTSDALGRLVQMIEDPATLNYSTTYNYCLGNLVGVSQAGASGAPQLSSACSGANTPGATGSTGIGRSFSYSSLGRLLSAANPESGTILYTYDDNGNLIARKDARNIITCFGALTGTTCDGSGYDALNRATRMVYSDVTTPGVTFNWANAGSSVPYSTGRLISVITDRLNTLPPVVRSFLSYDALGRVRAMQQQVGSNPARAVQGIIYNLAGGMTQEALPSGRIVNYGYDGAGRVSGVFGVIGGSQTNYVAMITNPAGSAYAYSAAGALQNMSMSNGVNEATNFNSRLQPVSIAAVSATGTRGNAALQLSLYYCASHQLDCTNNNGNLLEQDILDPTGLGTTAVQTYYYDALNRLCEASEAATGTAGGTGPTACASTPGGNWQQNDVYDAFGNRALLANGYGTTGNSQAQVASIAASAVAGNFPNNQWSGAATDPRGGGNVTTLYTGGPQAAYDAENRVSSVTESSITGISYLYDGEGRRVQKTVGITTTEYVYGASGELVAECGGTAPAANTTLYLTADHLGSTRMVTDANGTVTELRDYAPFGEELGPGVGPRPAASTLYKGPVYPSVTADPNNANFTRKERDAETGLDYFGARYFSAAQGRFASPDWSAQPQPVPYADLTDPQTLNLYSYVRNNPLAKADADGHCPWCIGALIGAGTGAGAQILSDWATGKPITLRKTFGAAVGGAIIGGTAGAATELGVALQAAIVADASVVGGIAERTINSGNVSQALADPAEIGRDALVGAGGQLINKSAEALVERVAGGAVQNLTDQLGRARTANRLGKVQDRLEAAALILEQKKTAASAATEMTRDSTVRSHNNSPCKENQSSGCSQ